MQQRRTGSTFLAALWMIGVGLVFFFMPIGNGVIAGLVGGYVAGSLARAVKAAIIPSVIIGGYVAVFTSAFNAPFIWDTSRLSFSAWGGWTAVALFTSAVLGGAIGAARSKKKHDPANEYTASRSHEERDAVQRY